MNVGLMNGLCSPDYLSILTLTSFFLFGVSFAARRPSSLDLSP